VDYGGDGGPAFGVLLIYLVIRKDDVVAGAVPFTYGKAQGLDASPVKAPAPGGEAMKPSIVCKAC
jgi:hypothetical protein